MAATPKRSWPWVRALLHSVYDQPDAVSVHPQFDRVLDALSEKQPKASAHLDTARADVLDHRLVAGVVGRGLRAVRVEARHEPACDAGAGLVPQGVVAVGDSPPPPRDQGLRRYRRVA